MAKEMLTKYAIPFTDYNVGADLEKRKEMVDKTGQMGVPVISVTPKGGAEEVLIGFDEERLKTLLNIH